MLQTTPKKCNQPNLSTKKKKMYLIKPKKRKEKQNKAPSHP